MGCSSSNSRNAANEKVIIEKIIKTEPELKAAFDNFTSDDIERIFILAKVRSYSPNEIICSKGTAAHSMIFVLSGEIHGYFSSEKTTKKIDIPICIGGKEFDENCEQYNLTVKAAKKTMVKTLSRTDYLSVKDRVKSRSRTSMVLTRSEHVALPAPHAPIEEINSIIVHVKVPIGVVLVPTTDRDIGGGQIISRLIVKRFADSPEGTPNNSQVAGVKIGDIIEAINGKTASKVTDLVEILRHAQADGSDELTLTLSPPVLVSAAPSVSSTAPSGLDLKIKVPIGVVLVPGTDRDIGGGQIISRLIVNRFADSPEGTPNNSQVAGVKIGDIIEAINGKTASKVTALVEILRHAQSDGSDELTLTLSPPPSSHLVPAISHRVVHVKIPIGIVAGEATKRDIGDGKDVARLEVKRLAEMPAGGVNNAQAAGIKVGDIIEGVNGMSATSMTDLLATLKTAQESGATSLSLSLSPASDSDTPHLDDKYDDPVKTPVQQSTRTVTVKIPMGLVVKAAANKDIDGGQSIACLAVKGFNQSPDGEVTGAQAAGVNIGDIIEAVDGRSVSTLLELVNLLKSSQESSSGEVQLTVSTPEPPVATAAVAPIAPVATAAPDDHRQEEENELEVGDNYPTYPRSSGSAAEDNKGETNRTPIKKTSSLDEEFNCFDPSLLLCIFNAPPSTSGERL